MTDLLLPPVPEPGDSTTHDAADDAAVTLLQSFMVVAGVSSDPDSTEPGVPVVVMDFVLVDAFHPGEGAEAIRIIVEHSDKSTKALLEGLTRAVAMLDEIGKPKR